MEPNRICGDCDACCYIPKIKEGILDKPACHKCPFYAGGCSIYNKPERPTVCADFYCSWIKGEGGENDRPNKNGLLVFTSNINNGPWIFAVETRKNAFRTTGKNIVIDMARKYDIPVIVSDHKSKYPEDKGDYIVIKDSLLPRTNKIRGKFLWKLADDIGVYELVITS